MCTPNVAVVLIINIEHNYDSSNSMRYFTGRLGGGVGGKVLSTLSCPDSLACGGIGAHVADRWVFCWSAWLAVGDCICGTDIYHSVFTSDR
jgi:hypothetical protein